MMVMEFAHKKKWVFVSGENFESISFPPSFWMVMLPTWSEQDFSIIESLSTDIEKKGIPIFILDIDDNLALQKLESKFGAWPTILQTPALVLYEDGKVVNSFYRIVGTQTIPSKGMW